MKRIIGFILIVTCVFCVSLQITASAKNDVHMKNRIIEVYEDGSYGVITVVEFPMKNRSTKTGHKSYEYYNSSNVKQWTIYLNATFTYTGTSATCTSATPSYTINNNSWSVTKAESRYSGAKATGEYTVKKYTAGVVTQTVNKILTLTCSASGVLS